MKTTHTVNVVTISPTKTITIPQNLQDPNTIMSLVLYTSAGGVHTVTINRVGATECNGIIPGRIACLSSIAN